MYILYFSCDITEISTGTAMAGNFGYFVVCVFPWLVRANVSPSRGTIPWCLVTSHCTGEDWDDTNCPGFKYNFSPPPIDGVSQTKAQQYTPQVKYFHLNNVENEFLDQR